MRIQTLSLYLSTVVPSVAPMFVRVRRTTATTANLTWSQLSLVESRGFLTAYKVTYRNTQRSCPQIDPEMGTTLSVDQDETQLVISDLDPRLEYCVGIAASTVAGMSDYSAAVKVPCKSATVVYINLPQKIYWSVASIYVVSYCFFFCTLVFSNNLFQVHLSGIYMCSQWVVSEFNALLQVK